MPQYAGTTEIQSTRENGWIDRLMNPRADGASYQDLKFSLHRKLLGRVHLEVVLALPEDRVRREIRTAESAEVGRGIDPVQNARHNITAYGLCVLSHA